MRTARLATRLREYDWLAALIELVIVVVGILIALQVSNWNQRRLDRARAQGYYERIHNELLGDRQRMDVTLAYWRAVSEYGHGAIAHGETGSLVGGSNWKTLLAWYQASQTMPYASPDSTITEMRSSGDLGLIADQRLRAKLEDYYSLAGVGGQSIIRVQDPAYRTQVRGLTPWPVQQYIWNRCFRESSYLTQEFVDCPAPISEAEAAAILTMYRQAPGLLDHLRTWMSQLRVSAIVLTNERRDATALAAAVGAARKR